MTMVVSLKINDKAEEYKTKTRQSLYLTSKIKTHWLLCMPHNSKGKFPLMLTPKKVFLIFHIVYILYKISSSWFFQSQTFSVWTVKLKKSETSKSFLLLLPNAQAVHIMTQALGNFTWKHSQLVLKQFAALFDGRDNRVYENWLLRWDFILLFKSQLTPESLVAFWQTAHR